jgi:hypothetical protein
LAPLLCVPAACAQAGPEKGAHELEVWSSGGHSVSGGASSIGVWDAGAHYGWILTELHGPGVLRGSFECAVGAVPVFVFFQPGRTTYGASLEPLVLQWNFASHGRVVPYGQLSGGVLFTNHDIPAGISTVNFTPSAAAGMHLLGRKFHWSVELRYQHISDAGLTKPNPGVNTIQGRIGFGWFSRAGKQ